ncbi:MAG: DeoR family transcriptional regulator [Ardenticatenaceae bacterium]|nr:DeoR family transcriptional regulator [Ardenticatenaceae bacterium]
MALSPSARQQQILTWLQENHTLSVQLLAERLQVSQMTIHRDLARLAQGGQVRKVYGGAVLASPLPETPPPASPRCAMCHQPIPGRATVTIQLLNGDSLQACCPHCGLMLLHNYPDAASILARDFLYGRMVNARQAFFVIGSDVQLCCIPSTLCFASQTDAQKFQRGFGGQVLAFTAVMAHLAAHHRQPHTSQ